MVPPNSNEFGNTYGEWSARWWQWLLSVPEDKNPNLDNTGANCAEAQTGQVWFWNFGDHAYTRSCTIPAGKDLLITPLAGVFGELGPVGTPDGPSDCPGGPNACDVQRIRALAAANVDNPQLLEVSVDDVRVQNVAQYRVTSPVFSAFLCHQVVDFTNPKPPPCVSDGAIADIPQGMHGPLVSDGYFVLLNPLSPGTHTIHLKGVASRSATIEVTYHLKVKK